MISGGSYFYLLVVNYLLCLALARVYYLSACIRRATQDLGDLIHVDAPATELDEEYTFT